MDTFADSLIYQLCFLKSDLTMNNNYIYTNSYRSDTLDGMLPGKQSYESEVWSLHMFRRGQTLVHIAVYLHLTNVVLTSMCLTVKYSAPGGFSKFVLTPTGK